MKKIFKSLFILSSLILVIGLVTNSCSQVEKLPYAVLKDSTLTFYYDDKKPQGAYDVEKFNKKNFVLRDSFEVKEWYPAREEILKGNTGIFKRSKRRNIYCDF